MLLLVVVCSVDSAVPLRCGIVWLSESIALALESHLHHLHRWTRCHCHRCCHCHIHRPKHLGHLLPIVFLYHQYPDACYVGRIRWGILYQAPLFRGYVFLSWEYAISPSEFRTCILRLFLATPIMLKSESQLYNWLSWLGDSCWARGIHCQQATTHHDKAVIRRHPTCFIHTNEIQCCLVSYLHATLVWRDQRLPGFCRSTLQSTQLLLPRFCNGCSQ